MKYNRLGNTGLFVSEICLGTMTFSGQGYFNGVIGTLNQKEATALIERSLAARVNFIDTADVYSLGESERMTGQALKDLGVKRSDVVITGEGSIDRQTLQGKGPYGVAVMAKEKNIPVIALAGKIPLEPDSELQQYFDILFSINNEPLDIADAMRNTEKNLVRAGKELGELLALKR